jgi:hypothetical protein
MSDEEKADLISDPYADVDETKTRRWFLPLTAKQYGELLIRLTYDNLSRLQLAQGLHYLYITNDPDFLKCLDKIKERFQKQTVRRKKIGRLTNNLRRKGDLLSQKMNLREQEDIQDLYSILEKDLPSGLVTEDELKKK